jgi:DNA-binding NarL/FixJ family response regulator
MVIDDHPIIHDGLDTLFANDDDLTIVAHALSSAEALKQLKTIEPEVIIIDLSLGDADGTYLVQRINTKYPNSRILVYSMSEEKLFAERVAGAGASGYVMKTSAPAKLKEAIRCVVKGESYFPDSVKNRIDKLEAGRASKPHSALNNLSNREMDVFKLIGEGMDTTMIGDKLSISRNTVDTHRINIKNKLGLPNGKMLDRLAFDVIQKGKLPK